MFLIDFLLILYIILFMFLYMNIQKLLPIILLILFTNIPYAVADYTGYSADQGNLIIRPRLGYNISDGTQTSTVFGAPCPTCGDESIYYGANVSLDVEANLQITDHLSFAAQLGYIPQGSYSLALFRSDSGNMDLVPFSALIQFTIAPYGKLQPYIGAGYHYTFIRNNYDFLSPDKSTSGPVVQVGADWWTSPSFGINFNAKYMLMEFNVDETGLLDPSAGYSENTRVRNIEANPLIFSIGASLRFGN